MWFSFYFNCQLRNYKFYAKHDSLKKWPSQKSNFSRTKLAITNFISLTSRIRIKSSSAFYLMSQRYDLNSDCLHKLSYPFLNSILILIILGWITMTVRAAISVMLSLEKIMELSLSLVKGLIKAWITWQACEFQSFNVKKIEAMHFNSSTQGLETDNWGPQKPGYLILCPLLSKTSSFRFKLIFEFYAWKTQKQVIMF